MLPNGIRIDTSSISMTIENFYKQKKTTFILGVRFEIEILPMVLFRISLSNASSFAFHSGVGVGAFLNATITKLILSLLP